VPALAETQAAFGRALLGGDPGALLGEIAGDGLAPAARLAVYRHHVAATLTDALRGAYPVVCRLVDERFFAYAADGFVAAHPPSSPCLFEYGAAFPDFLAGFAPCRHLGYLADVARLEWAMARAAHADDAAPLDPRGLSVLTPDEIGGLVFRLQPSLTLLRSPWPVDRIWCASQPDADPDAVLELEERAAWFEIRRAGDDVVVRALPEPAHALRRALQDGLTLAAAAATARQIDPALDLTLALHELFHDDVLVAFTITRPREEPA
jgi:hypothetical protein